MLVFFKESYAYYLDYFADIFLKVIIILLEATATLPC